MPLTNREVGQVAASLGHEHLQLASFGEGTRAGVRWRLSCSCGWTSGNFVLPGAAVGAGQHHLRFNVERHLRNGRRVLPPQSRAAL